MTTSQFWRRGALALLCVALFGPPAASSSGNQLTEAQVAELVELATAEKEDESRRARACRELVRTNLRTPVSPLRRLLREERSVDIRLAAACTLAGLGDARAPLDTLLAAAYEGTKTPNCSRTDVIVALGMTRSPAALFHLDRTLKADLPEGDPELHREACRALARVGDAPSRDRLFACLRDPRPGVRAAAVNPIAEIAGGPQPDRLVARSLLITAAVEDADEAVAHSACSALLWMGVDGPAFFRMLQHPDPVVRRRAVRVMDRHFLSPERLKRLEGLLASERDPGVRSEIEKALVSQRRPRRG